MIEILFNSIILNNLNYSIHTQVGITLLSLLLLSSNVLLTTYL